MLSTAARPLDTRNGAAPAAPRCANSCCAHGPPALPHRHAHRRRRRRPASATARAWPRTRRGSTRSATVDELNSMLGRAARRGAAAEPARSCLTEVQHDLFDLGGELSIPGYAAVTEAHVARLEAAVEQFNADLPPLKEFILPGGTRAAALAHVARTVCRRAERSAGERSPARSRSATRRAGTSTGCPICCSSWRACSIARPGEPDVLWRRDRAGPPAT